jgi:hypothetical protein
MNPLEARAERVMDEVSPQPPTMITVVLLRCSLIDGREATRSPFYIGRFASVHFLGGTERTRWKKAKPLRRSGVYDVDPFAWTPPISWHGGEQKAISEESSVGEPGP